MSEFPKELWVRVQDGALIPAAKLEDHLFEFGEDDLVAVYKLDRIARVEAKPVITDLSFDDIEKLANEVKF